MSVRVEPIRDADLQAVGAFLHAHVNRAIPVASWVESARGPWPGDAPNHGYLLRDGDELVGVLTALYSERQIDGKTERFCNVATWCVLPSHRRHSLRLLMQLLAQPDCHFTDLMPQGEVVRIMRRFGFRELDSRWRLMPNLPTPARGAVVVTDPEEIAAGLEGEALRVYRDHQPLDTLRHLLLRAGSSSCHVMFHRHRRRIAGPVRLPLLAKPIEARIPCATVLHLSAPEVLPGHYGALGRHFLLAERVPLTIFEERRLRGLPPFSVAKQPPSPRLYKSDRLGPEHVDNLYSEAVALAVPSDMR